MTTISGEEAFSYKEPAKKPDHSLAALKDVRVLIVAKALKECDKNSLGVDHIVSYVELAYAAVDALIEQELLLSRDTFIFVNKLGLPKTGV